MGICVCALRSSDDTQCSVFSVGLFAPVVCWTRPRNLKNLKLLQGRRWVRFQAKWDTKPGLSPTLNLLVEREMRSRVDEIPASLLTRDGNGRSLVVVRESETATKNENKHVEAQLDPRLCVWTPPADCLVVYAPTEDVDVFDAVCTTSKRVARTWMERCRAPNKVRSDGTIKGD